jgi:uncharacterized protein (TIGR02391 family)
MHELSDHVPTAQILLDLSTEELGARLLFLIRERKRGAYWHLGAFRIEELEDELRNRPAHERPGYPDETHRDVVIALREAWSWLEANGLIIPDPNGALAGMKRLSRRARSIEDSSALANYLLARRVPKELLHPSMADVVWGALMRGEFDSAVFHAMKAVEVAVRDAAGLSPADIGVKLMREAFAPERGKLTDLQSERAEQTARMEMFAGAVGSYKNPLSHRDVRLTSASEAVEIILFANHLLRIVARRVEAAGANPPT